MENKNSGTGRILYLFSLGIWIVCVGAVLLRILTIHPLDPAATLHNDIFDQVFLTLSTISVFTLMLPFTMMPQRNQAELRHRLSPSAFGGFLTALTFFSMLCILASALILHYNGFPTIQDGAYVLVRDQEIVYELSSAQFSALSYLTTPIVGKVHYDSIRHMWWALSVCSKAVFEVRRAHLIKIAAQEIESDTQTKPQ